MRMSEVDHRVVELVYTTLREGGGGATNSIEHSVRLFPSHSGSTIGAHLGITYERSILRHWHSASLARLFGIPQDTKIQPNHCGTSWGIWNHDDDKGNATM